MQTVKKGCFKRERALLMHLHDDGLERPFILILDTVRPGWYVPLGFKAKRRTSQ